MSEECPSHSASHSESETCCQKRQKGHQSLVPCPELCRSGLRSSSLVHGRGSMAVAQEAQIGKNSVSAGGRIVALHARSERPLCRSPMKDAHDYQQTVAGDSRFSVVASIAWSGRCQVWKISARRREVTGCWGNTHLPYSPCHFESLGETFSYCRKMASGGHQLTIRCTVWYLSAMEFHEYCCSTA